MNILKQSTSRTLLIGPFLDSADGNTAETGLTIAQADVRLSKNGGNMAQKNESTSCTHDELGYYTCPIDTTDTNTLGVLKVMVHETGALAVWDEFLIVTANVWDTLCSTDQLDVNVTNVGGTSQTANDNGADINTVLTRVTAAVATEAKQDTIDGIVDSILIDTGTTIPSQLDSMSGLGFITGTDSLEAIRDRGDAAWVTGAGGSSPTASEIRIEMDTNSTQLAAIVLDTGTTLPSEHAALATEAKQDIIDANIDAILVDTGTTIPGTIATVDANVDAILVDTAEIGIAGAGLSNINLPNQTMNITGNLSGSVGSVTADVGITAAAVDAILDETIGDGTLTMREALRVCLSGLAGKVSGGGTATVVFRNGADDQNVITATVDSNGNRTAVTVNP